MDTSEGQTVIRANGRRTVGREKEREERRRREEGEVERERGGDNHGGRRSKSTVPEENVVLCPCGCNEVSTHLCACLYLNKGNFGKMEVSFIQRFMIH